MIPFLCRMPYYQTPQSKRVSDQERHIPTTVHHIRVAFGTEGSIVPAVPSSCVSEFLLLFILRATVPSLLYMVPSAL